MIDFRYHLVSLISVFLALAVGIALGAGPLEGTIGDTLTGQVEQLRVERDEMRAQLDLAATELDRSESAFEAIAPSVLDGVLADRRVAVIEVSDVVPEVMEEVVARIGQAGGSVTATVQVTDAWTDPTQQSFRQQIAGTLVEYLSPVPPDDAGTDLELAEALVQALTSADPGDPDALAEPADFILEVLREAELVQIEDTISLAADAVVVLAGPTVGVVEVREAVAAQQTAPPEEVAEELARTETMIEAALRIATTAQARSVGAVVAAGALGDPSLVQRIRQDDATVSHISTVDGVQTVTGQVAVPLALSARIAGTIGHFGTEAGATASMPPRVVLPPVERVTPGESDDGEDTDADAEEGQSDQGEGEG